jgi:hypothetical protein
MLQSQKRASRCREITFKAFLAKFVSGLCAFRARRTLKKISGRNPDVVSYN